MLNSISPCWLSFGCRRTSQWSDPSLWRVFSCTERAWRRSSQSSTTNKDTSRTRIRSGFLFHWLQFIDSVPPTGCLYSNASHYAEKLQRHSQRTSQVSSPSVVLFAYLFLNRIRAAIGQTIFLSVLIGLIYLQLDNDSSSVQDRLGSLFFILINQAMAAVLSLVNLCKFPVQTLELFVTFHFKFLQRDQL